MKRENAEFRRLVEGYFDGALTADQLAILERRLRDDRDARRIYWEVAEWHAALSTWGGQQAGRELAGAGLRNLVDGPWNSEAGPARPRIWRAGWGWTALAAGVVIAGALAVFRGRRLPEMGGVAAQVVYQRSAVWSAGAGPQGGRMAPGSYRLERGMVRFDTRGGAAVTLAAPAEFRLDSDRELALTRGRLASRMLRPGARLSVAVRGLHVRDLGTAFGIDASRPDQSLISVFDGLVEIDGSKTRGNPMVLGEGQSVVELSDRDGLVEKTPFDPDAFKDVWPLTVGIETASDLVDFLPPGPLQQPLRDYRSNDRVFLFPERQNVLTARPVPLDISPSVPDWPGSPVSPYPLAAGLRINGYLVFFQPDPATFGSTPRHLSGTLVFRHKVLGMICSDQWLGATDAALGTAGVDYSTPHQGRGLEEADKDNYRGARLPHDSVRMDPDGCTVHFDFYVSDEREQLRIFTAAD